MADFYRVIDDHLTRPEVSPFVQPDTLQFYEMDRAIDGIFCAMNLLAQGDTTEAMARLKEPMQWRHFRTACRRPRRLEHLLCGVGLLGMGSLGAGVLAGRSLRRTYRLLQQWRRKCTS